MKTANPINVMREKKQKAYIGHKMSKVRNVNMCTGVCMYL